MRIPDCATCDDEFFTLEPRQGSDATQVLRDVGIDVDEDLGEEIEVDVEWVTERWAAAWSRARQEAGQP